MDSCERSCRPGCEEKRPRRRAGERKRKGPTELKVKSVQEREEVEAKNEREREKERKLRERTSRVDIALESARRVYAIFTLDLIFWRRPSLVRDRYMSHGHTRAARIKTSKRSQREFLTPSSLLASLLPSSASSFSILVAPSSRLPPYLVYPSFLLTASLLALSFSASFYTGSKMGYKKTKNQRASPITGSVFLPSSRLPTPS